MKTFARKSVVSTVCAGLLIASLGACSSGTSAKEGDTGEVLPPIMFAPADLEGQNIEITEAQPLVVTVDDDADITAWTGEVTDPAVAAFSPGEDQDGTLFNPGFTAVGAGETEASLTSPDGETYDFTLTVK